MSSDQTFTVEIDTSRLNQVLDGLRSALIGKGKDVSTILVDEHRRLTRTIVNFTPPLPKANAKWIGEQAVRRDLEGLISETSFRMIDSVGSEKGLKNIDTYRMIGGQRKHLLWDRIVVNPAELAELHPQYRNARGRVPRERSLGENVWNARIMVERGNRAPYIKAVQSRVGRWKAKWAYAAAQLGDRYPAWISRHFGYASSRATFVVNEGENCSITFGGRGPGFARDKTKIKAAVNFRVKVILRRIKLVISGYAKEIAQGMKVSTQAHRQQAEPLEDVN